MKKDPLLLRALELEAELKSVRLQIAEREAERQSRAGVNPAYHFAQSCKDRPGKLWAIDLFAEYLRKVDRVMSFRGFNNQMLLAGFTKHKNAERSDPNRYQQLYFYKPG